MGKVFDGFSVCSIQRPWGNLPPSWGNTLGIIERTHAEIKVGVGDGAGQRARRPDVEELDGQIVAEAGVVDAHVRLEDDDGAVVGQRGVADAPDRLHADHEALRQVDAARDSAVSWNDGESISLQPEMEIQENKRQRGKNNKETDVPKGQKGMEKDRSPSGNSTRSSPLATICWRSSSSTMSMYSLALPGSARSSARCTAGGSFCAH